MIEDPLAVTLPMAAADDSVADVLDRMDRTGATAIIVADDGTYQAQRIEDIRAAEPSSEIGTVGGEALGRLSTAHAAELGLDLSDLRHEPVIKAFKRLQHSAMVAAIGRGMRGDDVAVVLRRPLDGIRDRGAFTFLGDVYVCDVDDHRYSGPGVCPDHPGTTLRKISA